MPFVRYVRKPVFSWWDKFGTLISNYEDKWWDIDINKNEMSFKTFGVNYYNETLKNASIFFAKNLCPAATMLLMLFWRCFT